MASGNKAEAIAEHIRERIRTQEWVPGGFLPSERKLAEDLGVARNTLRAALQALEEEGAILRNGRHGCTILGRPSPMGSGLVLVAFSGVNGVLGTISPECMANLGAVLCTCGRADMRLQLVVVARDEVDRLRDEVKAKRAVGVLLMADQRPDLTDALRKDGTPFCVVNQEYDDPVPSAGVDFWDIGRRAAEHFLALGHRKLATLGGPQDRDMYVKLLAGFRGRAAEDAVFVDDRCVSLVTSDSEQSRAAALELLSREDRPTAIFCARDIRAYGAYLAARELGLRVPDDLSLIGYDNVTWPGQVKEFLTTFPEPSEQMAAEAVRILAEWMQTGEEPESVAIRPKLLIRRSAAPPRAR